MRTPNELIPAMVSWFRKAYPELKPLMVYCPRATKTLEKMGASYGCAEIILLYPAGGYLCLCIQILNSSERNTDQHKMWRGYVEHHGCKCATVRNYTGFVEAVEEYLRLSPIYD